MYDHFQWSDSFTNKYNIYTAEGSRSLYLHLSNSADALIQSVTQGCAVGRQACHTHVTMAYGPQLSELKAESKVSQGLYPSVCLTLHYLVSRRKVTPNLP